MFQKRDILKEICEQQISADAAYDLYEEILASEQAADLFDLIGLSAEERTAFAQSVGFAELASWRRNGWPRVCVRCGKAIEIGNFGWKPLPKRDGVGGHGLAHLVCPAIQTSQA